MSWQQIGVALIVLAAVVFLALKMFPRARPKPLQKPDVKASDLVKKKRDGS